MVVMKYCCKTMYVARGKGMIRRLYGQHYKRQITWISRVEDIFIARLKVVK